MLVLHNEYAWRRIAGFLDPWKTAQSEGYQLVQSLIAFGRGGINGVGLGNSTQKLAYLPEAGELRALLEKSPEKLQGKWARKLPPRFSDDESTGDNAAE